MDNSKRYGRGTSSNAYKIIASLKDGSPSQAFYTYVEQTAKEKLIGRSLGTQVISAPLKWGSLMECVVFNALPGFHYSMTHKNTILHPKKGHIWSGTPDLIAKEKVGEIKCFYLEQYISFALALKSKDIEKIKKEFPLPYWQLVSNCIICKKKVGELIGFIPKKSQLEQILIAIEDTDFLINNGLNPSDYYFFRPENIESFNYMPDDCKLDNMTTFEFEIPMEDKIFLIKKFKEFEKEVNKKFTEFTE
ncbi:MAG: hypothetical protein ACPGRW_06235 [Flavobacteriaceae bacterium]